MFTQPYTLWSHRDETWVPSNGKRTCQKPTCYLFDIWFCFIRYFPFSLHSQRSVFPSFSTIFIGTDAKKKELHLWCLCLAWQNLAIFHPKILAAFFGKKRKKQYLFLLLQKNLQKILTTLKILVSFECAHLKFHLLLKAKLALRLARLPQYQKVEGSFLSTKNLAKQFCYISDKIFSLLISQTAL